jgi:cytochrome c peroxidase
MSVRDIFTPLVAVTGSCVIAALAWGLWPGKPEAALAQVASERAVLRSGEPIQAIPVAPELDAVKVALGKRIFHDPQLSKNNTISCASCHDLTTAGVDKRPHSLGINKQEGDRNSPTVFNAVFNDRQFWDGRARSLEEQADGPLTAKVEMASDWNEVTAKIRKDATYSGAFANLYPEGIQPHTIKDALVTFERSLVTTDAPFDQFLRGRREAISEKVLKGYQHFKSYGCISCHQGVNVGGNMMQPFGVMINPAAVRDQALHNDRRLIRLTEIAANTDPARSKYKVPSLRNVARTEPYFHDGSVKNLSDAIRIMGISQLGRHLPEDDITDIIAFLESLTGKYEGKTL